MEVVREAKSPTTRLMDVIEGLEASLYPELALSLYLPARPKGRFSPRFQEHELRQVAKEYTELYLSEVAAAGMRRELPGVAALLEAVQPPAGHSVAVFSCAPARLLMSWTLPEDAGTIVRMSPRLYMRPMRRQLALHPPSLVIAADKEKARVFAVVLDEVTELETVVGRHIQREREGGWHAEIDQRREDMHAHQNLEAVVRWLAETNTNAYPALYIAGPPEARAELRRMLPREVAARVAAEFPAAMYQAPRLLGQRLRRAVAAMERRAS